MTESPAPSVSRWAVYLRLGRISNLPTVWTNCLAGVFLAGVAPSAGTAAPLLLALSCFYTGGMLLNDAFDAGHDRKFRPERPIPAGQIAAGEVFAGGFALLGLGEAVLGMIGPLQGAAPSAMGLLSGLVLGALIVFYDAHHKNNVLSPLVMALCRAMVYVTVAATVLPAVAALVPPARLGWGMVALVCYLIGLTYVAKQENLQQIRNLWPLVFLATPFVYCAPALSEGPLCCRALPGILGLGRLRAVVCHDSSAAQHSTGGDRPDRGNFAARRSADGGDGSTSCLARRHGRRLGADPLPAAIRLRNLTRRPEPHGGLRAHIDAAAGAP